MLQVQLLGRIGAQWDGHDMRLTSRGAAGVLALLAAGPRIRRRAAIAADLWPDAGPASGAALRQSLWLLRTALADAGASPAATLAVDDETVGLKSGVAIDLDVSRFEALARERPAQVMLALELYRGEFAEGLDQECFTRERERLADLYEDVLAQATWVRIEAGDLAGACTLALKLIGLDPLREEAHAALIEVYGCVGSRSQVTRQYRRLAEVLDVELGVRPLPETQAIYRGALHRAWEASARRQTRPHVTTPFVP